MSDYILKTITPIHIGSGRKLIQLDFIVANNLVGVVSFEKFLNLLTDEEIEKLELLLEKNTDTSIYNKIRKPIEKYLKYTLNIAGNNTNKPSEIAEHIKTVLDKKGNIGAYIPGSTVKGFIRFAILYKILKEKPDLVKYQNVKDNVKNVEENLFSLKLKTTNRPLLIKLMKFFKVSDSEPINIKDLEIRNVIVKFSKRNMSEYAEVIRKGIDIKIKIIDKEIEEKVKKLDLESQNYIEKVKDWKQACYEFSNDIIDFEIKFFENKKDEKLSKFYKELKAQNIPESPLLRIGKYKGKISQTLILLSNKNNNLKSSFPKTRRLADDLPLGWVKLIELK